MISPDDDDKNNFVTQQELKEIYGIIQKLKQMFNIVDIKNINNHEFPKISNHLLLMMM